MAEQEKTETQEKPQEKATPQPQEKQEKAAPQGEVTPTKETKEKGEGKPQNCTQCKKRLSRKQWYYRDGNTFCSKGCWKTFKQAKEKKVA